MKISVFLFLLFVSFSNCLCQGNQKEKYDTCFYNCTTKKSEILEKCVENDFEVFYSVDTSQLNPYDIFDDLISNLLLEEGADQYDLAYTFEECEHVCNAAATINDDMKEIILFNRSFINSFGRNKLAVISIFAHEIGHHLLSHTSKNKAKDKYDRRRNELRADYFSGYLISKLPGTTENDAISGLRFIDEKTYTPKTKKEEKRSIYPLLSRRMDAAIKGFLDGINSQESLAVFDDILKFAIKNKSSIIYRTSHKIFKSGDLLNLQQIINQIEVRNSHSIRDLDLTEENILIDELEERLNKNSDLDIEIEIENKELNINIPLDQIRKSRAKKINE